MKYTRVVILGAGQIGKAVYKILSDLSEEHLHDKSVPYSDIDAFVIDADETNIRDLIYGSHLVVDIQASTVGEITKILKDQKVTHVINALPFNLNEKAASAAVEAGCHYIDFTEDDVMADRVQKIYEGTGLICAVKCGLAPGFINYIGYDIVNQIKKPESLMISVGALPRTVSYDLSHPENSYNLMWSVDGLVNEYIRPCRIRKDGKLLEIPALGGLNKVIIDGIEYEAAYTSGGVGSLARDLTNVPNVCYMTLRYPGHYRYIREVVQETRGNFLKLRSIFLEKFPFTNDDVIVVYATATGSDLAGNFIRRSYSNRFYGVNDLTGIQSTTAGSGVAILELMLDGKLQGIIDHNTVKLSEFTSTKAFGKYYKTTK